MMKTKAINQHLQGCGPVDFFMVVCCETTLIPFLKRFNRLLLQGRNEGLAGKKKQTDRVILCAKFYEILKCLQFE